MYRSVLQQHSGSVSCLEAKIFSLRTNIHIYKALFFVTSLALQKILKFVVTNFSFLSRNYNWQHKYTKKDICQETKDFVS